MQPPDGGCHYLVPAKSWNWPLVSQNWPLASQKWPMASQTGLQPVKTGLWPVKTGLRSTQLFLPTTNKTKNNRNVFQASENPPWSLHSIKTCHYDDNPP